MLESYMTKGTIHFFLDPSKQDINEWAKTQLTPEEIADADLCQESYIQYLNDLLSDEGSDIRYILKNNLWWKVERTNFETLGSNYCAVTPTSDDSASYEFTIYSTNGDYWDFGWAVQTTSEWNKY